MERLPNLSLKKSFQLLFIISICALIFLSIVTIFFNSRLIESQRHLNDISRIDTARYKMINAVSHILSNQQTILTTRNPADITHLSKQNQAVNQFFQGLQEIQGVMSHQAKNETAEAMKTFLMTIQKNYQSLLDNNQQLSYIASQKLIKTQHLSDKTQTIVKEIATIHNETSSINGILSLKQQVNLNQIQQQLTYEPLSHRKRDVIALRASVLNLLTSDLEKAKTESIKLNTNFEQFKSLIYQVIQEKNSDTLNSLKNNQLLQVANSVERELKNLYHHLHSVPELNTTVSKIISQFKHVKGHLEEILQLRIDLNNINNQLQNIITHIATNQNTISHQYLQFDKLSSKLKNHLIVETERFYLFDRLIIVLITIITIALLSIIGFFLLRTLSKTLISLIGTMKQISKEGNLTYRLADTPYSDLNEMSRSFNTMTEKLLYIHEHLKELVDEKTTELKKAHEQIVITARHAGMADVARNVLHNIGNILNSVSVSGIIIGEKLKQSKLLNGFMDINKELNEHKNHLSDYLLNDPRGKHLIDYLNLLADAVQKERLDVRHELNVLLDGIQHIKDVVIRQQTFSQAVGIEEKLSISEQIDGAINLVGFDTSYQIIKKYHVMKPIILDKIKLSQILINLIRNAKDSMLEENNADKTLKITTKYTRNNRFIIQIQDNGIGILPENKDRIFSFGFTTKKTGHGFGLHTSALFAKEMHGHLSVESKGLHKGATFKLELPYLEHSPELKGDNLNE